MQRAIKFVPCIFFAKKQKLLHAVFVGFDHFLDHLAADGTCLTGGEVTVITVLEVDADFGSGLHLELIHSIACSGVNKMISGIGRHRLHLLFCLIWVFHPKHIFCGMYGDMRKRKMQFLYFFDKPDETPKNRLRYLFLPVYSYYP